MATKSQMLNVNMGFNADVSKAKSAIQDLQKDLDKLMSPQAGNSFLGNDFVKDIDEARRGAQQLSAALRSATNADTGKLDLTKFSQSLKKADLDIDKVKNSLTSFGPEGEKAFLKVANSIMDAEVPLKRTNKLFNDLWVTMKNTAKWQLSSSILHGFMGAIQTAYGYSQDLNESLNNIRIVTGYGADQMAEFAKQANQAAKSLSTTTTAYTNAALIYYQQGLPEEDIAARTNATVKMANVTGESAQDVSNYMTAIWNNFDDGSRSLEYYADVMTALGAATASSTDEIAAGLEKFAAVSKTVGLSYEYATSALATVTATTRQSADVVGNAFKTLFSRIQGLNLGETMEDGTTLNKYSQALAKVGIDIKDTNGQIKEMDVILDELGEKWGTLGKDTQIALAQAVAGVRQYTQLIALMNNWDTFKINLEVAGDAEGELDKQQAIYEESWEASSKRVRAAWEGIYDSILDDDFFISINNGFADFLSGIENVIDGLGGMKGVVSVLGVALTKAFGPQLSKSINDIVFSLRGASGLNQKEAGDLMDQAYQSAIDMNKDMATPESEAMVTVYENQLRLKKQLRENENDLTEEQKEQYKILLEQNKVQGEILIKSAKKKQDSDNKVAEAFKKVKKIAGPSSKDPETRKDELQFLRDTNKNLQEQAELYIQAEKAFQKYQKSSKDENAFEELSNDLKKLKIELEDIEDFDMTKLAIFDGIEGDVDEIINKYISSLRLTPEASEEARQALEELYNTMRENVEITENHEGQLNSYNNGLAQVEENIVSLKNNVKTFGDGLVGIFQGISELSMAVSSLSNIKNIINDETLTSGERFLQIITALSTGVPALISGIYQLSMSVEILKKVQWSEVAAGLASIGTKIKETITTKGLTGAIYKLIVAKQAENTAFLMTLGIIGAVIAAIGLLTAAIIAYSNKQQEAFRAMQSANEEAQKAAEAYNNMKDSYADLIDTISNYEDAKNAISDLNKGTEEWQENINKANEYAQQLIDTYDELAGNYHFNAETGVIEFNPGVLEELQSAQQNRLTNVQANSLMADSAYKRATNNYNIDQMVKSDNEKRNAALYGSDFATTRFAATNEQVTSVSQLSDDDQKNIINKLIDEFEQSAGNYSLAFNKLTEEEQQHLKSLGLTNTELQELCNNIRANNQIIKLNNQQLINSKFANTDTYKNFEEKDALNSVLANVLEIRKQEINDSYNGVTTDDMRKKYAEEMGYQTTGFTSRRGKTTFYDMEGNEVVFSDDTIRLFNANTEALAELSGRIDSLAMAIDGIESRTGSKSISESLTDWLSTGNMLGMSQNDRYEMSEKINTSGDDKLSDEEILTFLQDSFGVDEAGLKEIFGVEDVNEIVTKWINAWENGSASIKAAGENITKTSKKVFDELKAAGELDDLSGLEANQLGEYMDQILGEFGKTGLDRFSEIFAKTGEDADEFINVLDDIDWQTTNVSELERALKEAGVTTDFTSQELAEFIEYMRGTGEASDLATAREHYTTLQGMSDLSLGDTITQDQMNTLTEVNPALSNFFTLMADGTYALTESAAAFNSVVEDLSTQKIGAYVNQVNERMELAGNLRDSNFNYDSAISLTHQAETMGAYAANSSINMDSSFDYLEMMNGRSAQLEDWRVRSAEGTLEASDYEAIRVAIEECGDATKDWEATVEGLEAQAQALQDSINFSAYKDQVADLGLDFEFTESYAEDLAENMEDLSDEMEASGRSFNNIKQAARDLAIANQRLDRGLSGLAGSYDDYIEKLTDANKGTVEYTKTMNDLKDNLADIFNTDAEYLSSGFIEEAFVGDPEKLKQIADGNMEVIRSMRAQVASEVAGQIYEMNVSVDSSEVDAFVAEFDSLIATMPDLTAMAKVDGENAFIEKLNGLIQSAGMTRDQVQALLGSMGMSAELVTEYKQTKVQVPVYKTYEDIEPGEEWTYQVGAEPDGTPIMATVQGYTKTSATVQSGVAEMDGYVPVTSVKTITEGKSSGGGIDIIDGGVNPGGTPSTSIASSPGASSTAVKPSQSNVYNPTTGKGGYTGNKKSSGGGGGNKEAKTSDPKKLEDEIDRYYDIDNILEKISRQLKKIQQQSDTLYGASKIAAMEHEIEVLKEQEQAYRDKAAAAEGFIKADREAAAQWGYTLSYDSDGNISNYQQVMTQAVADLNAYKQQYNAMSADEQERFEPVLKSAEDRYEGLLNAMSKYEDTLQTFRDAEDAAEEARLQRLAKNYEKITHKLEYKLSIVEQEIEEIDYYVNKLSDDFYSMGEALAMASGKTDEYFKILNLHSVAIEELSAAYEAGEITQADYIEGMENERQGIYDTLEALQEMDKFMLDYYGETLDAATDEIEKFTDQMDHLNNVLEHYQNIMSLIGKENNYDQMGILLKGQADIAQDSLEVAKATYEMFKQQKEDILAQMEGVEEGSAAWDGFKRQLDDITVKLNDAEEEMLSRTEEWVEAMRSLLENDLANAYKTLENSFTNGMGFDYLTDSIDRAREHYDLFLTNTNKLYETNKLINNAQAKADKLTSLSAKQKVKDFIDETQALQDKNKLSKIELQIQQAKYDLVLAQIALEEAQNSKSRVRLQRDSEGNFNYVYTSDADAISEAEQNLMDAENALYNIRLEAANAAGEQMVTTAREWADALYQVDLDYMNGVITSEEEWRAKRDQINKDFLQQMADYQDQYGIATKEDSKIVSEAWCNPDDGAYPLITKSAEDWKINTNNYISQVNGAFEEWKTVVDQANEVVGKDLDATKQKVNELTEASDALKDEVVNEVLPAISSELNTVQDLTSAYFNQRQEIMNLIGEYERLAERIKDAIDAQKELNAYQAQAQKDLSDTYTGGQFTYADEAPPKEQGGGGGGYQPPPGYDDTLEKPADSEKRYRISAIFNNGAAISGAGYKSESSARSRINQEGNKNKGVKSSSIIAYLGKKNEMEFFQYTKLGTQTNTTTSYSNSLIDQSANNILGLDTGGYTGVWGPEGKLAALHEKELVLNESDTKNMLLAVKIVRDINNQIENSAKYFGSLSSHIGLPAISDMSQILEQTVTIDANFPNVESRYEIEEAFKNLMNTASQFANRKRL